MAELLEPTRNRLLRRADWRFLLPDPRPEKTACFAGGLLARAVELISTRTVHGRPTPSGDCDLAVAVDPDRTTLLAAWESLHPDGCCYTEWYSPARGGSKAIQRRLEAAGFEAVTCYWFWPPRPSARYWVPLQTQGALAYFLSHPPPATGLLRLGGVGSRAAWRLSQRLGLTLPVGAIARKHARLASGPSRPHPRCTADGCTPSTPGPRADLLETIRTHWSAWGLGAAPDDLSSLLLTGGPRTTSKVVELVFAEPDHRPRLVIKRSRVPESVPGLAREAATLQALHASRSAGVSGAPRVLFCLDQAGLLAVGETAMTGRPVFTQLRRSNYRDVALRSTAWLADLAGSPAPSARASWGNRLIETVVANFEASFGAVVDAGLTREAGQLLATVGDLPLVCEQRDFSPWNVLLSSAGELAVLDWESAELQGLPVLDLFYFLTYLAFFVEGAMASGRFRESYRRMLSPSSFTGRVLNECVGRYLERTGVTPDVVRPLRVLTWMLHSRSEYLRFTADAGGRPTADRVRRSLFVRLFEEELRRRI